MREAAVRFARRALSAGVLAAIAFVVRPGDRALVVDAYVLFIGALALQLGTSATRRALPAGGPSAFERALRRLEAVRERPDDLTRLEREVILATDTAFDFHFRLRPALVEVAAHRLSVRRGIDLELQPRAAREALGDQAWQIVRADLPSPVDRSGPGRPLRELRAAVDAVESL